MRPDPTARDARDSNRATALRALQERDQARRSERFWHDAYDEEAAFNDDAVAILDRVAALAAKADSYGFKTFVAELRAEIERASGRFRLAAIDGLHQPDGPACGCGQTHPCPTRRELDR